MNTLEIIKKEKELERKVKDAYNDYWRYCSSLSPKWSEKYQDELDKDYDKKAKEYENFKKIEWIMKEEE